MPQTLENPGSIMSPDPIQDIADVERWIIEHATRCNAWWEEQHRWNAKMEKSVNDCLHRVTAMEKRVMWLTGAAAVLGSGLGQLVF